MRRTPTRHAIPPAIRLAFVATIPTDAAGQWTNRYPKVRGQGHPVYLEGFELPMLTNGPIDPARAWLAERARP